jgi:hypothetical protein
MTPFANRVSFSFCDSSAATRCRSAASAFESFSAFYRNALTALFS